MGLAGAPGGGRRGFSRAEVSSAERFDLAPGDAYDELLICNFLVEISLYG
jgi:hypothetical protein